MGKPRNGLRASPKALGAPDRPRITAGGHALPEMLLKNAVQRFDFLAFFFFLPAFLADFFAEDFEDFLAAFFAFDFFAARGDAVAAFARGVFVSG